MPCHHVPQDYGFHEHDLPDMRKIYLSLRLLQSELVCFIVESHTNSKKWNGKTSHAADRPNREPSQPVLGQLCQKCWNTETEYLRAWWNLTLFQRSLWSTDANHLLPVVQSSCVRGTAPTVPQCSDLPGSRQLIGSPTALVTELTS